MPMKGYQMYDFSGRGPRERQNMSSLYERIDEVPFLKIRGAKSLHRKLNDNRDAAELARQLTGIETAVPSALETPDLVRSETDTAALNRLFDELSFGGMLRQRCLRL